MRKFTGMLLVLLAAVMIWISAAAILGAPETADRAGEAVWLGDDRYDPANDGKLVVALLSPEKLTTAADPELGLRFDAVGVTRRVEVFSRAAGNSFKWNPVPDGEQAEGLGNASLIGDQTDPDALKLDPSYVPMLPSGDSTWPAETDQAVLDRFGLREYTDLSKTYLTDAAGAAFDRELSDEDDTERYESSVGRIRVSYLERWPDGQTLAFIGIQRGQTLVPDDSLDMAAVSEETESLEAMIGSNSSMTMAGSAGMIVCALVPLFFGLRNLGALGKRKEKPAA